MHLLPPERIPGIFANGRRLTTLLAGDRGEPTARDISYIQQRYPNIEAGTGRRYWLDMAIWRHDAAQLEQMQAEGRIVTSRAGVSYIKRYSSEVLQRAVR